MARNDDEIRQVPLSELKSEEGAHDLATSPNMEPYLRLAMAELQAADLGPELETIRRLPLEKRYIWRVASALRWAFADFDSQNVATDIEADCLRIHSKRLLIVRYWWVIQNRTYRQERELELVLLGRPNRNAPIRRVKVVIIRIPLGSVVGMNSI